MTVYAFSKDNICTKSVGMSLNAPLNVNSSINNLALTSCRDANAQIFWDVLSNYTGKVLDGTLTLQNTNALCEIEIHVVGCKFKSIVSAFK